MDRIKLMEKSFEELHELQQKIMNDPKNQMPKGSFYRYTPSTRKKLETIAWAITNKMKDEKKG